MDIRRLEYFCAIIDKGQISKAARSLHISQSPLSQRLRELEEELGVTLIHRGGRAWQVTPEGYMLYRRAQHILTFMNSLRDEVRGASDRLHGLVRIGISPPCREIGAATITSIFSANPDVRFQSWIMDNQSLERHLQEGHLDFGIALLPVRETNYHVRRLRSLALHVVFGRGLVPPDDEVIDIRTLSRLPLIVQERREGGGVNARLMEAFQKENLTPKFTLTTQDSSFLRDLLLHGMPAAAVMNDFEVRAAGLEDFPRRRLLAISASTPAIICLENAYISHTTNRVIDDISSRY